MHGKALFENLSEYPLPRRTGVRDYIFHLVPKDDAASALCNDGDLCGGSAETSRGRGGGGDGDLRKSLSSYNDNSWFFEEPSAALGHSVVITVASLGWLGKCI